MSNDKFETIYNLAFSIGLFGIGHLFIAQLSKLDKQQIALYTNQTMNKDAATAAVVGFSLGLIVAVMLWLGPRFFTSSPQQQVSLNSKQQTNGANKITITAPSVGEVVKNKTMKVEGSTQTNHLIVITSPVQESITAAAPDGSFAATITLEEGANELSITSYTEIGEIYDSILLPMVYTSENL